MSARILTDKAFARRPISISAIAKFDNTIKSFNFAKTGKEKV